MAKFKVGDIVRCVDLSGLGTGAIMAARIKKRGSDIFRVTKLGEEPRPGEPQIIFVDGRHPGSRDGGAYDTRFVLAQEDQEYNEALEAQEAYQAIVGS